jgi:hypothetical protein
MNLDVLLVNPKSWERLFTLPKRLEEHRKAFDIGSTDISVSKVDTDYLSGIFDNFVFNNIKNETITCIRHGNILLFLLYYIRKFMEKQNRKWFMKAFEG